MSNIVIKIEEDFNFILAELIDRELLIDSNRLLVSHSQMGTSISWSNSTGLSYLLSEYSKIEQYLQIINRRDFNLCFFDGGIVQIYYFIKDEEIIRHRLCYIPCPFDYDSSEEENVEISLEETAYLKNSEELLKDTRLTSPIRFDFDGDFSDEKHTHSHVTINKRSCRIPTYGPVSLGHFFRFVLRYFYEEDFDNGNGWERLRPKLYTRTLGYPSPHEIHIESSNNF